MTLSYDIDYQPGNFPTPLFYWLTRSSAYTKSAFLNDSYQYHDHCALPLVMSFYFDQLWQQLDLFLVKSYRIRVFDAKFNIIFGIIQATFWSSLTSTTNLMLLLKFCFIRHKQPAGHKNFKFLISFENETIWSLVWTVVRWKGKRLNSVSTN